MKTAVTILATLLLACSVAVAAPGDRPSGPPPPPPPPGLAQHLELSLTRLSLDEAQQAAVAERIETYRAQMLLRRDEVHAAHEALRAAVIAPTLDEAAIRAAAVQVAALDADRAVGDATLLRDIRALLTEDQRAQLDAILASPPAPPDGMPPGSRPQNAPAFRFR